MSIPEGDRRTTVLDAALITFARFGYRKTSMEEVARTAQISRPGLYFLFSSKESLFRAAVTQALERNLDAIKALLDDRQVALGQRLLNAFDLWAGSYVGPERRDVTAVIDDNPGILGAIATTAPQRFEALITAAVAAKFDQQRACALAQTLISISIGIKHQVEARAEYRARFEVALGLLLP